MYVEPPSKVGNAMWKHIAIVEGRGKFPTDMLRYDCCFPYSGEDVSTMLYADDPELRQVKLVRFSYSKQHSFTVDRWVSFGWGCNIYRK